MPQACVLHASLSQVYREGYTMYLCVLCVLCLSKPLSEVCVGLTYYALSLSVLCVCFTPSCNLFHLNQSTVLQQFSQDVVVTKDGSPQL